MEGRTGLRNALAIRIIAVLFLLVSIWLLKVAVSQLVGEVYTSLPSSPDAHSVAIQFDPADPKVEAWTAGYFMLSTDGYNPTAAIEHYRRAVSLAPTFYQHWGELGTAYELAGNLRSAEICYRNMLALAPNFQQSHWSLANCLLRKGDLDDSTREFRRYLELNPGSSGYVFDLLSKAEGNNLAALENTAVPNSEEAQSKFSVFAAAHDNPTLSVAVWRKMPSAWQQSQRDLGLALTNVLLSKKEFGSAKEIWRIYAPDDSKDGNPLAVYNGSFERPLSDYPAGFGWHSAEPLTGVLRIAANTGHSGKNALAANFSDPQSTSAARVDQLLAPLAPGQYQLSYFAKGKDLSLPNQALIQIVTEDGIALGSNDQLRGDFDWTERKIRFAVPAGKPAIRIIISVLSFGPINLEVNGQIWLDDFSLTKL